MSEFDVKPKIANRTVYDCCLYYHVMNSTLTYRKHKSLTSKLHLNFDEMFRKLILQLVAAFSNLCFPHLPDKAELITDCSRDIDSERMDSQC